jgi:hypothetical protein
MYRHFSVKEVALYYYTNIHVVQWRTVTFSKVVANSEAK